MVADLVRGTLVGLGFEVIDLGLATTPTVEMAVPGEGRCRHHPHGQPQSQAMERAETAERERRVHQRGRWRRGAAHRRGRELRIRLRWTNWAMCATIRPGQRSTSTPSSKLDLVDTQEMAARKNFKVVVDAVNSVGGVAVPHAAGSARRGGGEAVLRAQRPFPAQPRAAARAPAGPLRRWW
jgi:phosphomannomutase